MSLEDRRLRKSARIAARRVNCALGQRCEDCGADDWPLHKHHPDYSKPRAVVFLCAPCHRERHREHTGVRDLDGIRRLINELRG